MLVVFLKGFATLDYPAERRLRDAGADVPLLAHQHRLGAGADGHCHPQRVGAS